MRGMLRQCCFCGDTTRDSQLMYCLTCDGNSWRFIKDTERPHSSPDPRGTCGGEKRAEFVSQLYRGKCREFRLPSPDAVVNPFHRSLRADRLGGACQS